jgi:lipid A ethanolaminephosphotransferase
MVMWTSAGFGPAAGMAGACLEPALRQQTASPVAHDHLFHTLLGWLDVRTALYEPGWDLSAACRRPIAP